MTATFAVRAGTSDDAAAFARLRYEFRVSLGAPEEDAEEFVARCTTWMRSRLAADGRWRAWVAEDAEGTLGTVWVGLIEKMPNPIAEPEENGYVTNFYVRADARGRGVGTALLDAAIDWCRERGVHTMVLWPTRQSRSLYERRGFAQPAALMELVVTGEAAPWPTSPFHR